MEKLNEKLLKKLYIEDMKTDDEIAIILHSKKQSVYRARKRFNIKAYKRWERNICEPTQRQIEIIYGSLLGDAHISDGIKHGKRYQSIFEDKHCEDQKKYVFWKYKELKSLCGSTPKPVKNKEKIQWRVRTFHHPFFTKLRDDFYPEGIKIVNEKSLNLIGPLGLAVWFMDDGSNGHDGLFLKICTCSFSAEEHCLLFQWLYDKFNVQTRVMIDRGYRFTVIEKDYRTKFLNLIAPYIIPSMKYKLSNKRLQNA